MFAQMYQIENAARCAMGDALHDETVAPVVRPAGGSALLQNAAIIFVAIAAAVVALGFS